MIDIREINDLVTSKSNFTHLITRGMDQTIVGQKHLIESLLISLLSKDILIFLLYSLKLILSSKE